MPSVTQQSVAEPGSNPPSLGRMVAESPSQPWQKFYPRKPIVGSRKSGGTLMVSGSKMNCFEATILTESHPRRLLKMVQLRVKSSAWGRLRGR